MRKVIFVEGGQGEVGIALITVLEASGVEFFALRTTFLLDSHRPAAIRLEKNIIYGKSKKCKGGGGIG